MGGERLTVKPTLHAFLVYLQSIVMCASFTFLSPLGVALESVSISTRAKFETAKVMVQDWIEMTG